VLADAVASLDLDHPTRVAVDGITASGKTTLARELTGALVARGRPAVHLSMDGFHHPRAVRHRQGRESADGYYEDAYDFGAFVREVLAPLDEGGEHRYRARIIDLPTDTPVLEEPVPLSSDAVLVVDGSFLQRAEMSGHWDLVIFLDVAFDVARQRGAQRDAELLGGVEAARTLYERRYHAAARRYLAECTPRDRADLVVDNTDPHRPRFV